MRIFYCDVNSTASSGRGATGSWDDGMAKRYRSPSVPRFVPKARHETRRTASASWNSGMMRSRRRSRSSSRSAKNATLKRGYAEEAGEWPIERLRSSKICYPSVTVSSQPARTRKRGIRIASTSSQDIRPPLSNRSPMPVQSVIMGDQAIVGVLFDDSDVLQCSERELMSAYSMLDAGNTVKRRRDHHQAGSSEQAARREAALQKCRRCGRPIIRRN